MSKKSGTSTIVDWIATSNQTVIPSATVNENVKSMSGTRTHARGRMRSGKCTFWTSTRFARTQLAVSVKITAMNTQGTRLSIEKTGYGSPCEGSWANFPKISVKTTIVRSGWSTAQAMPIADCL